MFSVIIDKKVYESKPEKFVVDHPFMIVIQHKPSDTPLFVGSIRNIPWKDWQWYSSVRLVIFQTTWTSDVFLCNE